MAVVGATTEPVAPTAAVMATAAVELRVVTPESGVALLVLRELPVTKSCDK